MNRKNPMQAAVREIGVKTETGQTCAFDQRSRRARRRYRRSLQAPLADRAVLPGDEADAQDHSIHRKIRKRGAHPNRGRPDRLPSATRSARDQRRKSTASLTSFARARQSHAQKRPDKTSKTAAASAARLPPIPILLPHNMNRTAVGLTRPSTWFGASNVRERGKGESFVPTKLCFRPPPCRTRL